MTALLESSLAYCRRLTRERARNFYYGFLLLPRPRRDAFCSVYAFMRYCDDIADGGDSIGAKRAGLKRWREALDQTLRGDYGNQNDIANLVLPAFHHAVRQYSIPAEYFHALIDGAEMDLTIQSYGTFSELYEYCYRVASVVGLCSLHMMGFREERAKELAEQCGIAFQLTNILRDIQEDARTGRVYLPEEDLKRFRYSPEQLAAGIYNDAFVHLMQFQVQRARAFYEKAYPLLDMVEEESRPALWTLITIYRGVLERIEQNRWNVFSRAAALTDMEKIGVLLQAAKMRLQSRWNSSGGSSNGGRAALASGWRPFQG
jgi:phytoene synthase